MDARSVLCVILQFCMHVPLLPQASRLLSLLTALSAMAAWIAIVSSKTDIVVFASSTSKASHSTTKT